MEHRTVADPVLKVISWVGSGCRSMAANCHSLPTLLVRLALLRHRLPILETPAQLMYRPRSTSTQTKTLMRWSRLKKSSLTRWDSTGNPSN